MAIPRAALISCQSSMPSSQWCIFDLETEAEPWQVMNIVNNYSDAGIRMLACGKIPEWHSHHKTS